MSWSAWCERGISDEKGVVLGTKCGIFDRSTGAKWGSIPPNFDVPAEVVKEIIAGITRKSTNGVHIDGVKFQFIQSFDLDPHFYAVYKSGQNGLSCALSSKACIIGYYEAPLQPGVHAQAIFQVMTQLMAYQY